MDRAEIFLVWLTSQREGTYERLVRTISSFFAEQLGKGISLGARRVVAELQYLGYLRVDWSSGHWQMCLPSVHLLPGGVALATLRGGRRADTLEQLESAGLFPKRISPTGNGESAGYLPQTVLIEFDGIAEARAACLSVGLRFDSRLVERLALSLPPIAYRDSAAAGPAVQGAPLQKFDPSTYRYSDIRYAQTDGLYRQQGFGLTRYWARIDNQWYQTSRAEGQWLACSKSQSKVLIWEYLNGQQTGQLRVPSPLVFPPAHVELLSACSGVLPDRLSGQWHLFHNIPGIVYSSIRSSIVPHIQPAASTSYGR